MIMNPLPESVVSRSKQERVYGPVECDDGLSITATVRYDDTLGNGHNTFGISAKISDPRGRLVSAGCLHDEVAKAFPELTPLIAYHLMSSDGPLHYLANTLYWLGYDTRWCNGAQADPPSLSHARKSAVWPHMPESMVRSCDASDTGAVELQRAHATKVLTERLDGIRHEFRAAVLSLGFIW